MEFVGGKKKKKKQKTGFSFLTLKNPCIFHHVVGENEKNR